MLSRYGQSVDICLTLFRAYSIRLQVNCTIMDVPDYVLVAVLRSVYMSIVPYMMHPR